jgi:hypothetical protein
MCEILRASQRKVALSAATGGMLLVFPGCGNHLWEFALDAALDFVTSQALRGFLQNRPAQRGG